MTASLVGEEQLEARLRALASQGKPIMGLVGLTAVREQKRLVPRKTANLARSIHLERTTPREAITVASASYARAVEFGTRPHDIRPRKARALRFPGSGTSTTLAGRVRTGSARALGNAAFVFAKAVRHPGTKAQPFMLPGARRAIALANIKGIIVSAWNKAA